MGLGYHILVLMVRAYVYGRLYTICTAGCTLFDQPTVTFLTAGDTSPTLLLHITIEQHHIFLVEMHGNGEAPLMITDTIRDGDKYICVSIAYTSPTNDQSKIVSIIMTLKC
jgi:hypothetical protein